MHVSELHEILLCANHHHEHFYSLCFRCIFIKHINGLFAIVSIKVLGNFNHPDFKSVRPEMIRKISRIR